MNDTKTLQRKISTKKLKPGLAAFYDLLAGNAVGLLLQSQSPHRAASLTASIYLLN